MSERSSPQPEEDPTPGGSTGGPSVGVLGPMVLLDGAGHVVGRGLGGPKQRLVLAVLLSETGQVVPVDRLVAGVWGEDADDGRRRSLRAYVSRLRVALSGVATIDHRHGGYALDPAGGDLSDSARFERLVEGAVDLVDDDPDAALEELRVALEAWRGRPFGDLADEPALADEVARLERLRLRALETVARMEIDRGEHGRAVTELRPVIAEHPLREPLWRLLMLALYRSGRQGEALQEYQRVRTRLAEELGADPSRQLQDLHEAILRQDPSLEAPPRAHAREQGTPALPTAGEPAALGEPAVSAGAMVGRGDELAELRRLTGLARSGRPQLLLLAGEAGVGKSRLLGETAEAPDAAGFEVLVGRCIEIGDGNVPFSPVADAVRRLASRTTAGQLEELLGPWRHDLARIVPELGQAPVDQAEGPGRLFAAVLGLVGRSAQRQPLLLALEDVHWADRSTLDMLGFLARSLDQQPLLLVVTFRTDELHRRHPLRRVLGELARLPNATRVDLQPLDRDDTTDMVSELLGSTPDPSFVDAVFARSSGNPFFVEELVAAAQEDRPGLTSGLHDVVASRLDRLPDETRRVVEVAAVAGGTVDQQLLAAVTGEDPLVLAGHLRPAVDRHVLLADDTVYRFRHDLVREVVVDDLQPGEQLALHARIAAVLEEHRDLAPGGATHADAELAHHWYAARDDRRAFEAALRAGDHAREAGAHAEATALDDRVLELWDKVEQPATRSRVDVLHRAARTADLAGRYGRAVALLREALDEVDDDRATEAELRSDLALLLVWDVQDPRDALAEGEHALALVADEPTTARTARVVEAVARVRMACGDVGEHVANLAREARSVARTAGDERTELRAQITFGTALAYSGRDVETGLTMLRDALHRAEERGDDRLMGRGHGNLVVALGANHAEVERAEVERAMQQALTWLGRTSQLDLVGAHTVIRAGIADVALRVGDWELAQRVVDALDVADLEGDDRRLFLAARAHVRWSRGDLDGALEDVSSITDDWSDPDDRTAWAVTIAASVAAEQGRVEDVRRLAERHRPGPDVRSHDAWTLLTAMQLRRALVRTEVDAALAADDARARTAHLDRADEAVAEARRLDTTLQDADVTASTTERRTARATLLLALAERSRAIGARPEPWMVALDHVVLPYDRVYAQWRLSESLLADGDQQRAADHLRHGHRWATRLGAGQLRRHIEGTAAEHGISLT